MSAPSAIGARIGPPPALAAAATAGASAGFFLWSFTVERIDLPSLVFQNNVSQPVRLRLAAFLLGGALLAILLWVVRFAVLPVDARQRETVQRRWAGMIALAIVPGFWPVLAMPAIEVYHPALTLVLVIGMLAVIFLAGWQLAPGRPRSDIRSADPSRGGLAAVLVMAAGYAAFFSVYTVRKHLAFHSYAFDLGWQHQAIFTLLHTGNPRVTPDITILHFANHFQPLYYLLAPVYALRQDPATLLVLQSVLLSTGAIPLFLIARRKLRRDGIALVVAAVYLLFPALHGMNTYDFHGLVLLAPILCFLLYFLETGRMGWYWVFFGLALITREDAPITLSGVALYQWLALRKPRPGLIGLAACAAYFLAMLRIMSALGGYPNVENYWQLVLPEHQSYAGLALTLLTNPLFVLQQVFFNPQKILYLLQIFLPVLFLPFFAGRKMVLLVPGLAVILLSGGSTRYSIGFHYPAHLVAGVFFLAICGMERIEKRWPQVPRAAIAVTLLAAGMVMNVEYGLVLSKRFPGFPRADEREQTAYSFFRMIPAEASVATISRLYPHLSGRTEIYLLNRMRSEPDYVLADLYPPKPALDAYEQVYRGHAIDVAEVRTIVLDLLDGTDYGAVRYENGFLLLQRGSTPARNREVGDAIRVLRLEEQPDLVPYYRDPAGTVREPRLSESDRLVAFLSEHPRGTILVAGSGDVVSRLSYMAYLILMRQGSRINLLRPSGSYVAIIREGVVVFERFDNRAPVSAATSSSQELREALPGLEVSLRSAGQASRAEASIAVDGAPASLNQPGLLVVVLDAQGHVSQRATFCTGR